MLILIAGILNAGLGYYLIRTGRRANSLILEADGKHVLTDSWTSFGVVAGLVLVLLTHWKPFDPLVAIAVAVNILWSGGRLVWRSAVGLLDYSDPEAGRKIRERLDAICAELNIQYHGVRFRTTGYRQIIEVHLFFPRLTSVSEAHSLATILEERLDARAGHPGRGDHTPGVAGRPRRCPPPRALHRKARVTCAAECKRGLFLKAIPPAKS